jgi:uncharacterized protein with von Willebrand factor type A (vWA) domain
MKRKNPYLNGASLAYQVPRWDQYQWSSFLNKSPQTKEVITQGEGKLFAFPAFSKEVFHRLYNPQTRPLDNIKPEHAWASKAHEQLSQVTDFGRLAQRCRGDRMLAGVAATAFCEQMLEQLPAPPQPLFDPQPLRQQVRSLKGLLMRTEEAGAKPPSHIQAMLGELTEQGKQAVLDAQQYAQSLDDAQLRQSIRASCAAAEQATHNVQANLEAFSFGAGRGTLTSHSGLEDKLSLAQCIQSSSKLQQIAKEAGRMRRIAVQKQRSKCRHARSEVSSIETGAELSRLLPAELVKLAQPSLFGLFARGYIERGLLQYQLAGKEPQGRGPLVVCLDSSGSMAGEREIWSKAVALALLSIAVAQKRTCRLLHFTEFVERIDDFPAGQVENNALLTSMEVFFDGGTDYEEPLRSALQAIQEEPGLKRADVVFITDGECCVTQSFMDTWQKARQEHEFTCYGVLLGLSDSPMLHQLADSILPVTDLANDTSATSSLFAI